MPLRTLNPQLRSYWFRLLSYTGSPTYEDGVTLVHFGGW